MFKLTQGTSLQYYAISTLYQFREIKFQLQYSSSSADKWKLYKNEVETKFVTTFTSGIEKITLLPKIKSRFLKIIPNSQNFCENNFVTCKIFGFTQ